MTRVNEPSGAMPLSSGQHLATISHAGRFWEVHLEFKDEPRGPAGYRGLLSFTPVDGSEPARRTTTILVEDSYQDIVSKARTFEEYQLQGLLRSLLPDTE